MVYLALNRCHHRQMNYKDTKTKCRLLKNWPRKGGNVTWKCCTLRCPAQLSDFSLVLIKTKQEHLYCFLDYLISMTPRYVGTTRAWMYVQYIFITYPNLFINRYNMVFLKRFLASGTNYIQIIHIRYVVRQWTLTSTPFFRLYLSRDKSCRHNIKKYKAAFAFIYHGEILCWSTQMSNVSVQIRHIWMKAFT